LLEKANVSRVSSQSEKRGAGFARDPEDFVHFLFRISDVFGFRPAREKPEEPAAHGHGERDASTGNATVGAQPRFAKTPQPARQLFEPYCAGFRIAAARDRGVRAVGASHEYVDAVRMRDGVQNVQQFIGQRVALRKYADLALEVLEAFDALALVAQHAYGERIGGAIFIALKSEHTGHRKNDVDRLIAAQNDLV
jgi:hypothetical protein